MNLPTGLSPFRHRNFRLFWTGMLISLIGTWMQSVGEAWLVLQLTHDPVALGIVAACAFGPVLVLGLFGGIVADSVSKRKALYVTQVVAGLLALTTGTLVATGVVQVWMIYVIALLLGVNSSFDMPIRQSFVVEMVGREDVAKAVALNSAVFNMSRIVGPAIGGLTIAAFGIAPLYYLNALSYIAVIYSLWRMRPEEFHSVPHMEVVRTARGIIDRLVEGLRYVRNNEQILLAISILTVVSTFSMNFNVLGPLLAANVLHGDADTYGFLMAASGAGSLAGALLIAFGSRPTMLRLITGTFVAGIGLVLLSLSSSFGPDLVLMFVIGWGTISMAATCNTIIQLNVPDVLRGRVMSVYTTLFAGTTPIGGLFSGAVAAAAGVSAALGIGGIVALGSSAVGYWRMPQRPEIRPIALLADRNARHR
ncbi:MAG TPA: MFS transporter [Candidatus Limnocylindrales bacterium]|jgi:MFS family permease